uniref:Uncharacterized protein n=1 Tax=Oryza glumipatula TaxID=40148 RepID=A0A0D9YTC9_9ORYZ
MAAAAAAASPAAVALILSRFAPPFPPHPPPGLPENRERERMGKREVFSTYGPAAGEARWERAAGNGRCGGAATREKGRRSGGRDVKTVLGEMTRATGGALRGSPALGDDDGLGTSQRGAR